MEEDSRKLDGSLDEPVLARQVADECTNLVDHDSHGDTRVLSWAEKRPWLLLAFFCAIMFFVWFDNGMFASNGVTGCSKHCAEPVGFSTAQGDFDLSAFQLGVLAAMYMVGLMIASIALIPASCLVSPFRLIGVGMFIWTLAAIGTGLSQGFVSLLIARTLVGAGEASIITLSAPFIDDVAPKEYVSLWFAILSSAPPLGVAIGMAQYTGWRFLFFLEAVVGILIVLIASLCPSVDLKGIDTLHEPEFEGKSAIDKVSASFGKLWGDTKVLFQHPVFILGTFANSPIQACVGAFTFWGPKMARELFSLSLDAANLTLGGLTIICAISGILGGGALLDFLGASIHNALLLQLFSGAIGLIFCALSLNFVPQFSLFCVVFGIGLFGLFIATAPLYALGMWSLPPPQRPAGQAFLVVIMHVLGDVPSPPIVGAIQSTVRNWHVSMTVIVCYLFVSLILYSIGLIVSRHAQSYIKSGIESDLDDS